MARYNQVTNKHDRQDADRSGGISRRHERRRHRSNTGAGRISKRYRKDRHRKTHADEERQGRGQQSSSSNDHPRSFHPPRKYNRRKR